MKLSTLLASLSCQRLQGPLDREISSLCYQSQTAGPGSMFVCLPGANADGHSFARQAVAQGAAALIVERPVEGAGGATVLQVENSRAALALLSAVWFGHPARELTTIGITGTKGKTTTACAVAQMLQRAGRKTALIGTLGFFLGEEFTPTQNTTPESYVLQECLRRAVDAGCGYAVMEVSSQALKYHRTDGIFFDCGVFTNLSPDHIGQGEHPDFQDYLRSKALLFRQCRLGIVNGEDPHVQAVLEGHICQVEVFGSAPESLYRAEDVRPTSRGGDLGVRYHLTGRLEGEVYVRMPGRFTVSNSLAAIAVCSHLGVPMPVMQAALAQTRVKGRLERVETPGDFSVYLDYAHNAYSLEALLTTLREYNPPHLYCLFGCGGGKDRHRRREMGRVSGKYADYTVLTTDNPRFEDPRDIIQECLQGVLESGGVGVAIEDREQAVAFCLSHAGPGDIIVMAGKGQEDYQDVKGAKYPFDERGIIRAAAMAAVKL